MKNEEGVFSLADAVLSKLDCRIPTSDNSNTSDEDEKFKDIYSKVGVLLSRYKSGKLPKAFKVIPSLQNWEKVLLLTNPSEWTTNATYEATRIFVSNLSPKMAQKFLQFILLPRLREDISRSKKVDVHLYAALKKAVYKPAAFFKGIIIPLCECENLTLREATIVSSVLLKVSVPVLHSAAALYKIIGLPYLGGRSIFVRTLLDKKYSLPSTVIEKLVRYFKSFSELDDDQLPVLWHQSFLTFVQRYKLELTLENKQDLLMLSRSKAHPQISPEIERELSFMK